MLDIFKYVPRECAISIDLVNLAGVFFLSAGEPHKLRNVNFSEHFSSRKYYNPSFFVTFR